MRRSPEAEGRRWLEQAEEDLRWATDLAERGGYHIACFLAQQVAEKALKAFLYASGDDIVLGHSVERLGSKAAERDADFIVRCPHWSILDSYYIPTRYPNGLPDGIPAKVFNQKAAREAVALSSEIVAFVRQKIGSETADQK